MSDYQNPIFILGSQRSGTTMLRLMLNAHPHICVPHESAFITNRLQILEQYGDLSDKENVENLLDDIAKLPLVKKGGHIKSKVAILENHITCYQDLVQAIFQEYMLAEGKRIWCDKTPYYTDKIDTLYRLFPQAKFIHLIRDGRDVALSQKKIEWLPNSLPVIAEQWRWKTMICHKVGSVLPPGQFYQFHYEDLVNCPETELRTLCGFIGVDFEDSMLDYHVSATSVVPNGSLLWHRNSISKPDKAKIYGWKEKMSVADQTIFEQVAGDALAQFNYEVRGLTSSAASKLKNLYYSAWVRY